MNKRKRKPSKTVQRIEARRKATMEAQGLEYTPYATAVTSYTRKGLSERGLVSKWTKDQQMLIDLLNLEQDAEGNLFRLQKVTRTGEARFDRVKITKTELTKAAKHVRRLQALEGYGSIRELSKFVNEGLGTSWYNRERLAKGGFLTKVAAMANSAEGALKGYVTHLRETLKLNPATQEQRQSLNNAINQVDEIIDVDDIEAYNSGHYIVRDLCYLFVLLRSYISQEDESHFVECGGTVNFEVNVESDEWS